MTIKYYDLGREIMAYSGAIAPGIVECENGKYVRREDYEALLERFNEMEKSYDDFRLIFGGY